MAGGKATLLHHIFQKTGMTPDEFYQKPPGVRAFLFASMEVTLESYKEGGGQINGRDSKN